MKFKERIALYLELVIVTSIKKTTVQNMEGRYSLQPSSPQPLHLEIIERASKLLTNPILTVPPRLIKYKKL